MANDDQLEWPHVTTTIPNNNDDLMATGARDATRSWYFFSLFFLCCTNYYSQIVYYLYGQVFFYFLTMSFYFKLTNSFYSFLGTIVMLMTRRPVNDGQIGGWKKAERWQHIELVLESPVRSGLLTRNCLDRDRDRSMEVSEPQKTGPDRLRPVFCGPLTG